MNYMILEDTIILAFDGKTENVNRHDKVGIKVLAAIKDDRLDDIPDILNPLPTFGKGVEIVHGIIEVDGVPISTRLAGKIEQFAEEGLPFDPLANFARKLAKNPSFNSRKMLYEFLEHNGHPITPDGNFVAYRSVTEDFKDHQTKQFDNSVGSICEMPRDEVDDNPYNTCSNGLHVAAFEYASGFRSHNSHLIMVEVDPVDVVCVPNDYNGTKMRVCKFKVLSTCNEVSDDVVYEDAPSYDEFDEDY